MGNDDIVQAKGKSAPDIETMKARAFVKCAPSLYMDQNLHSVGPLMEHGYMLNFEDNHSMIYDKNNRNQVVAKVKMLKNINFPLTLLCPIGVVLKLDTVDQLWLWQRRLGYLNFASL